MVRNGNHGISAFGLGGRCAASVLAAGAVIWAAAAQGQTHEETLDASPRHQEWIDIPYGAAGETVTAFVVHPESSEATDSIVVIHDIRGMSDWIRVVGDELAENGYVAVVPDLLSGHGPDGGGTGSFADNAAVGQAIRDLDPDEITARLKACADYARELPSTTEAVSISGFCWGGAESFRFASNEPSLKAAFVFYGSPPEREAMARIECPVYGFYGENDNRINSTLADTETAMADLGKTFEPVIYPGTGHGFLRAGMDPEADDSMDQAVANAWARWLERLSE